MVHGEFTSIAVVLCIVVEHLTFILPPHCELEHAHGHVSRSLQMVSENVLTPLNTMQQLAHIRGLVP